MKAKLFFAALVAALALVLPACNVEKATGPVVQETRDLAAFDRLTVNIPGRVEIVVGSKTQAEISVEESVLDILKTEISGGRLLVEFEKSVRDVENLVVRITVPSLTRLDLNGSADVVCADLMKGQSIDINLNGSGDIDFSNLDFSAIDAAAHGSGDLILKGKALDFSAMVFGSGDLAALETMAERATVENSGSGDAALSVASKLKAKITGSGDISYRGEPTVEQSVSGSGKLNKL